MVNKLRVLFFVLAAFISCTVFTFCNQPDDNAALYYLKAIELLKYPDFEKDKSTYDAIEDIIKNGYNAKNTQIETILKNNEPAFQELTKGVSKSKCNFFPAGTKTTLGKRDPNYMALKNLSKLSIVKGLQYSSLGEFNKASSSYANVIILAKHLPQQIKLLRAKEIEVALISRVTPSIKTLVQEKDISKEMLIRIDKNLHDYELYNVALVDIFQQEKYVINDYIKTHIDALIKQNFKLSAADRELLRGQTVIEAEKTINTYVGYCIKAVQTSNSSDWDFADKEQKKLSESTFSNKAILIHIGKVRLFSKVNKKAWVQETAIEEAKVWATIFVPNAKRTAESYYSAMNGIKEVRELIAKRLR